MGEIVFDPENPLGRLPGESLRANQALRDYALLGAGRSQRKLFEQYRQQNDSKTTAENAGFLSPAKPPARRLRTLAEWSSRFAWQERVEVWERLADAADEQLWAERRRQLREDEWEIGLDFLELARSGLAESPKFVKTIRRFDAANNREIITMAIDLSALAKAGQAGDRFLRLAADMSEHIIKMERQAKLCGLDSPETQDDDLMEITLAEWKKMQEEKAAKVAETLADFEDTGA